MTSRPILFASAAASLAYLLTADFGATGWRVFLKVASIALLALLGFRVSKPLGAALTLGTIGDFLLGVPRLGTFGPEQLFLFGLGAFLCGHLVYIVMFWSCRRDTMAGPHQRSTRKQNQLGRSLAILAVVATLICVLGVLHGSLGPLLVPVVVYSLVLATMAISAILTDLGDPLAAVGALCFIASDAMLALAKFNAPFPASSALIWITYYAAQLLIFLGVARGLGTSQA
jgi:uncharacterized membrane protein YhhN